MRLQLLGHRAVALGHVHVLRPHLGVDLALGCLHLLGQQSALPLQVLLLVLLGVYLLGQRRQLDGELLLLLLQLGDLGLEAGQLAPRRVGRVRGVVALLLLLPHTRGGVRGAGVELRQLLLRLLNLDVDARQLLARVVVLVGKDAVAQRAVALVDLLVPYAPAPNKGGVYVVAASSLSTLLLVIFIGEQQQQQHQ